VELKNRKCRFSGDYYMYQNHPYISGGQKK
jgi:hypothetical protein